ncbi:MAG: hypothetical protein INQ03_10580 [Candidatus Heimdallarchaeota archaeon]|nr:hypothetical protein [Candidatus Heimdallarchaeota archaeon]
MDNDTEVHNIPWVAIPGVIRPNFSFKKLQVSFPTQYPSSLITMILYASIFYIYIGGVYNLVEDPLAFGGGVENKPILIYPDEDKQFLIEGIVAGTVMMMGAIGLYLIKSATNDPHDTAKAISYQVIGTILTIIALFILQNMYQCKKFPDTC